MGRARTTLASCLALLALGPAASAAAASEFTASKTTAKGPAEFPLKVHGNGIGPQEFQFKKIHVVCQRAHANGTIQSPTSPTLALTVSYGECLTGPVIAWGKKTEVPMHFKEKAQYTFHINGYVQDEEEIEMRAKYLHCLVDWGTGTIPSKAEEKPTLQYEAATYSDQESTTEDLKHFPSGIQHKLLISNQFTGMEWEEEGGGLCEDPDIELAEGENGKYNGQLLIEVPHGNIEA